MNADSGGKNWGLNVRQESTKSEKAANNGLQRKGQLGGENTKCFNFADGSFYMNSSFSHSPRLVYFLTSELCPVFSKEGWKDRGNASLLKFNADRKASVSHDGICRFQIRQKLFRI